MTRDFLFAHFGENVISSEMGITGEGSDREGKTAFWMCGLCGFCEKCQVGRRKYKSSVWGEYSPGDDGWSCGVTRARLRDSGTQRWDRDP